ncbi:MAG: hypothetical protein SGILL_004927, partial [Bacillariaceae sp.]
MQAGLCTNPYANGGCLWNKLRDRSNNATTFPLLKKRTCNSQDPPEAVLKGYCTPSEFGYTEVRIEIQNWDSATFITWLLQIILSEMLGVPSSIETSFKEAPANLYQPHSLFGIGWADDERALNRSSRFGDCVPFTTKPVLGEGSGIEYEVGNDLEYPGYLACAHVISESAGWWTAPYIKEGMLEPNHPNGVLGRKGWYIPLHTAKEDPSLLHYTGLMGEENREKLASTFKRPVTYYEYCEKYSATNCTSPDQHAFREPIVDLDVVWSDMHTTEHWRYYVEGAYHGFFVETEKNDCIAQPQNCTGHIVDFPCGWGSYVEPT